MIDKHIAKRNKFLENVVMDLEAEYAMEALRIFIDSSREFRKNYRFPHDMTGPDYYKMLDTEFAYQKRKVMEYIHSVKNGKK